MSNIRNLNAGNPFWDFLASLNNNSADHPFYAAFNPEARSRESPPGYDAQSPPQQEGTPPSSTEDPPSPPPPPPTSGHAYHGPRGHHDPFGRSHHHHGGPRHRGGWNRFSHGHGSCNSGPNFPNFGAGWPNGGFDMSKLVDFISQFVPDDAAAAAAIPRPRDAGGDSTGSKDFSPEADIFDTEDAYIVHLSLPGAKKEDVGVNWDADKSELNVAGVIYRPGDEDFLKKLALDERKVGVFERKVRLGSRQSPAQVDSDGITAKLEDGILMITIPKLDKDFVDVKKVDIE